MNTHKSFEVGLRTRIIECEQEMRRAGWQAPNFDERSYRGTPVEAACRDIEAYILEHNVLRAGSIDGL